MINKKLKSNIKINIEPNRTGEVVKYVADITKARNKIGYNPKVDVEEGLNKSIKWYKTNL
jgi:nucleoside-diphosphate-sugar epimerase